MAVLSSSTFRLLHTTFRINYPQSHPHPVSSIVLLRVTELGTAGLGVEVLVPSSDTSVRVLLDHPKRVLKSQYP